MNGWGWDPPEGFDYGFPLPVPEPVADCDNCRALTQRRHRAREVCDLSAVSDTNVLMRKHHADEH